MDRVDACCDACREAGTGSGDTVVPMVAVTAIERRPPTVSISKTRTSGTSRERDRQLAAAAIGMAGVFVALAGLALVLGPPSPAGWLPIHLVLAGAASTAIAGVMPYFSAAIASVPPASPLIRAAGIALVAVGALVVIASYGLTARTAGAMSVGAVGGLIYIGGMAAVALATVLPLRRALGTRYRFIIAGYGTALASVAVGASLATLFLAGVRPVLEAWDVLKPAHVWLNVWGFLSLVIAVSMLHLLPTTMAARIGRPRAASLSLAGLALGPIIVAAGFIVRRDAVAILGAALTLVGALALGVFAVGVIRRRGRWNTDAGWHHVGEASLLCAIGWFVVATAIASWAVVQGGATAQGWSVNTVLAPLVVGWALQALIGSWTHLVPSIGPGDPATHAIQRRRLGWAATPRLVAFQVGVALLSIGTAAGMRELALVGALITAVTVGTALLLLGSALIPALRQGTSAKRVAAA